MSPGVNKPEMIYTKYHAKALLTVAVMAFIIMGLTGCVKPKVADQTKQPTLTDTIANMGKTGKVIGCVFAPWSEDCKALKADKKPHQSQEEYLEEVNEDFENLDKELSN